MERFSQRESVLLGYNNFQRPLTSRTSKPLRNSDVDFHDVFGGPPRRFSMQEIRPGSEDDEDDDDDVDEAWTGVGNKPVFGDDGASRRNLPSADFFADIFGGRASVHSTPKRHSRDHVFPSSPGSKVLSPLPPKADPFGTSSFLSQFSLPGKVSKAVEVPTFGSSSRSQNKHKDGSPNGIPHSLSSQTSLSRFSIEAEASSPNKDSQSEANSKKDSESLAANNGHFHFSIYKWKTKGIPLDIPLKGKASRSKDAISKSETSEDGNETRITSQSSSTKTTSSSDNNGQALPNVTSSTSEHSSKNLQNGLSLDEIAAEKSEAPSAAKEEPQKPEVKSVHSLFYDDLERGLGEKKSTRTPKKQEKVNGVQSSPSNGRSKVKGRVKDFVKMFNHESPAKGQDGHIFRNKSCKWNDKFAFEEDEERSKATGEEEKPKPQMPYKANEDGLKHSAKVHDSSTTNSGSLSYGFKATVEETDESFHDNFQVKELTQDENGQLEFVTHNKEFQDIDIKIKQWTKGKEGNIRSLLSTLQYVLWAESEWKTVPLVDIIEGSAVKRAYQKALLCLHPDKLQQKGAASHQKYTAEKVFDILQEAWNYFNSLGAV